MTWFLMPLQKFATFSGRSRRKEYWMFFLFTAVVSIVLAVVDMGIGTYHEASGVGLLSALFTLAVLIPWIAVTARRFHDIGKSGWLQLLFIIPLVGLILWIVWMARAGDQGPNSYGPDPKLGAALPEGGPAFA
jgi:uncharacterized membrane protein YhaH (DUF805 family)